MADKVQAVGSLLDDGAAATDVDDGFGASLRGRYRGAREYEDGVLGMGVGDELEGRAFNDAEFNQAFAKGLGRRRMSPGQRAAKQRAIRDGNWAEVSMQGSGLRQGDTARGGRTVVLDGADTHPSERARVLAELEDAEHALAALTGTETSPSPPPPEPPPPAPEPTRSTVGSEGDTLGDLAALEAELGLDPAGRSLKVGYARVTREHTPQETIPTRAEVETTIATARESGELPSRTDLEAMLDDEGQAMTDESTTGYMPPAKSVEHMTPMCVKRVVDLVWPEGTDLDPFASRSKFSTIVATVQYHGPDDEADPRDGLVEEWDLFASEQPTRVYWNSPYGRFIAKACTACVAETSSADVRAIALLKSCTDTAWFHEFIAATATAVCFVRGRLHYVDGETGKAGPAPFSSILVLWDDERFAEFKHACEVYVDEDRKYPLGHVIDLRVGRE